MADLMTALGAGATADAGIRALVGVVKGQPGVYRAGHVQQGAVMPYLVYQLISEVLLYHQGGQALWEAIYQFDCVADTATEAEALAKAVEDWLDNYRDTMNGVTIRLATLDDERDAPAPPTDGTERGPWVVQQDYTVHYVP